MSRAFYRFTREQREGRAERSRALAPAAGWSDPVFDMLDFEVLDYPGIPMALSGTDTFYHPFHQLREETEPLAADELLFENLMLRSSLAEVNEELSQLRQEARELGQRVERLEGSDEPRVVVLREITREQAKHEIRELFGGGRVLDYEAIVTELSLDLELVVNICDELIQEGAIGPDAGTHESR